MKLSEDVTRPYLYIYSQTNCPNCVFAAQKLKECGVEFIEIKIDKDTNGRNFVIGRGFRTVPQIYNPKTDVFVEGGWLGLKEMTEEQVKAILYGKS